MNKALSIALLFAAVALVAANGSINLPKPHNAVNGVSASINELHKGMKAAKDMDMSKCECAEECKDTKQEYCKVTTELEYECEEVDAVKEFIECKTKCFTADKVIEIGVPTIGLNKGRRLFESQPMMKDGQMVKQHPLGLLMGGAAAGGAAGGAAAGGANAAPKEICREICSKGTRPVKEKECGDKPKTTYDCEDRVIYTSCKNVCTCPNGVTIETKKVPALLAVAAAAKGGVSVSATKTGTSKP